MHICFHVKSVLCIFDFDCYEYTSIYLQSGLGRGLQHLLCRATKRAFSVIRWNLTEIKHFFIRDAVKLAQLVRARHWQSRGRRFNSIQNSQNRGPKSAWI